MADGLKFSLTVIYPASPGNMTSIQPILTSLPDSRVYSMEDGITEQGLTMVTVEYQMDKEESELSALGLWDLILSSGLHSIDYRTAEFLDHNRLEDISGNMSLTLRFGQSS